MGDWTLFSNHGHVLLYLAGNNEARLRDVAGRVGITERAVQKIVRELQEAGYLTVTKHGRCNRYRIHARKPLRHPIESHCTVAGLVQLVAGSAGSAADIEAAPSAPRPEVKRRAGDGKDTADPRKEAAKAPQSPGPSPQKPAARKKEEEAAEPTDSRHQGSLF